MAIKNIIIIISLLVTIQSIQAAKWTAIENSESVYSSLATRLKIKTYILEKKKSSEYFINSLKQLVYNSYWYKKVVSGSVDIEEIPNNDLSFIIQREFQSLKIEELETLINDQLNIFHLGSHEDSRGECIDLIIFHSEKKHVALYSECY